MRDPGLIILALASAAAATAAIRRRGSQSDGTEHFSMREWADVSGKPVPSIYRGNVLRTMRALEVVRSELGGRPITITPAGGWRTQATNAANPGRAKNSLHLEGKAADIIVDGVPPSEVFEVVDRLQREGRIPRGGAKAYPGFTHMDIRGSIARW